MISIKTNTIMAATTVTFAFAMSVSTAIADEKFVPDSTPTIIVPFGAGGGSDILARTIANVIDQLELLPTNIQVENHPGGSGARGYNYIAEQRGDPYTIGTVSVSFFTTPLLGSSPVDYRDFTPIAAIAMSPYIVAVPEGSDINDIADLKSRERLTTGTPGVVSDASLLSQLMQEQSGATIDAVPFDGVGEVLSAMLGGHIDFMFGNPGEIEPQLEAGTLRALAVSTDERLPSFPEVPTLEESGYDIEHVQLRGIVMPMEISDHAVSYWEDIFRQVAESDAWEEEYLNRFGDVPRFVGSEEFSGILEETNDLYARMMNELDIEQ
nr:tripartite tricarboxylate transporter substrate binding protein [Halomonas socia]